MPAPPGVTLLAAEGEMLVTSGEMEVTPAVVIDTGCASPEGGRDEGGGDPSPPEGPVRAAPCHSAVGPGSERNDATGRCPKRHPEA